jgi:hypothetical protein
MHRNAADKSVPSDGSFPPWARTPFRPSQCIIRAANGLQHSAVLAAYRPVSTKVGGRAGVGGIRPRPRWWRAVSPPPHNSLDLRHNNSHNAAHPRVLIHILGQNLATRPKTNVWKESLMKRLALRVVWILVLISAGLAASCSNGTSPAPAPQAAAPAQPPAAPAAPPASAPAPPAGVVAPVIPPAGIANSQSSKNPDLRCDLMEVRRVSGGALLIKWRLVNASAQGKTLQYYSGWNVRPPAEGLYYIDPAENKKYSHLTDTDGHGIEDLFQGDIQPGEQRGSWAKFPAPPATSGKISVNIPDFPPFEDIPVSQ